LLGFSEKLLGVSRPLLKLAHLAAKLVEIDTLLLSLIFGSFSDSFLSRTVDLLFSLFPHGSAIPVLFVPEGVPRLGPKAIPWRIFVMR